MTDEQKIANMLAAFPLYKKLEVDIAFMGLNRLENFTFSFYCPNEDNTQTFKLNAEPVGVVIFFDRTSDPLETILHFNPWDSKKELINYTSHFRGTCQYCKRYLVHFLIQGKTEAPLVNSGDPRNQVKLILSKVGQYPLFAIKPNKKLVSFFNQEDKENYKKALFCLSQNYGIAAFSYLRRIVENEILKIIEALSKLDRVESEAILGLLVKYQENHQMGMLINAVFKYLPGSLKDLGSNPLDVLYSQLSGGIHQFSEDECFQKAELIDDLLRFVIIKLNEEQSDVKTAREAMKRLSGNT